MAFARKMKSVLFTYPHCDITKEVAMGLFKDKFKENLKYCVVAEEKHQDGEAHLHVLVMLREQVYFKRADVQEGYDFIKKWWVNGIETVETIWGWFLEDICVADLASTSDCKAGQDYKSTVSSNMWYRRFHCNVEGVRSPKNSIDYCKKEGNYAEYGEKPQSQKELDRKARNKLLLETPLEKLVEDGEISIMAVSNLKKNIEVLRNESAKSTFEKKNIHWFYGGTGTGKTRTAWEEAKEKYGESVWVSKTNDQWFDGYEGQSGVILDDIRSGTWGFANLLRITDRYPIDVAVKGGFRKWRPKEIWITAPVEPRELYRNYKTDEPYDGIEQLERRIDELREFE